VSDANHGSSLLVYFPKPNSMFLPALFFSREFNQQFTYPCAGFCINNVLVLACVSLSRNSNFIPQALFLLSLFFGEQEVLEIWMKMNTCLDDPARFISSMCQQHHHHHVFLLMFLLSALHFKMSRSQRYVSAHSHHWQKAFVPRSLFRNSRESQLCAFRIYT
jgi:hypothetical protein